MVLLVYLLLRNYMGKVSRHITLQYIIPYNVLGKFLESQKKNEGHK